MRRFKALSGAQSCRKKEEWAGNLPSKLLTQSFTLAHAVAEASSK